MFSEFVLVILNGPVKICTELRRCQKDTREGWMKEGLLSYVSHEV